MTQHLTATQRSYQKLVGLRFGAIFAGCIALMWTSALLVLTAGTLRILSAVTVAPLSIVCLALGIYLFVTKQPHERQTLPYFKSGAFWAKFYGVIAVESIAIFVAIRIFQAHNVDNIVFPIIVLIVGLHFYPLASWNGNPLWYGTATVLSAAMFLLLSFVPNNATTTLLGTHQANTWSVLSVTIMVVTMIATSAASSILYLHTIQKQT